MREGLPTTLEENEGYSASYVHVAACPFRYPNDKFSYP